MIKDYDKEFGPGGWYAWPADVDVAGRFLEAAPYSKSSAECLDDDFFGDYLDCLDAHLFYNYPEEEAAELAEAEAKSRQELLKDAKNWPLPYLVASAVYKILSTQEIHKSSDFWSDFLWPFLVFDEPLFDMLRAKGWDNMYRNELRKWFKFQLSFEIRGVTLNKLVWGSDREKPSFTCQGFTSHISPEDLLRCFDLVGIDPDLARSAVDQVFKLQSLTPFYDALFDNPSLMPAILVECKR